MYVKLAEMAKDLKPLNFGWFSILTRLNNSKILSNMRTLFANECELKDSNRYTYDNIVDFIQFVYKTHNICPPVKSGIFIYNPKLDTSKTSYKCDGNEVIIDISNIITPYSTLSIFIDLDDKVAEVKYAFISGSSVEKDAFRLTKSRGTIKSEDSDATYVRIFALQEIRYAMISHIQNYIDTLYDIYT